jgi:microcystin-dependent protein
MDEYMGMIKIFAGNFAPKGWLMCNGQLLSIAQNSALFSLLGTIYGGDGVSTFALPNFQSRMPIGMGQGPGLSYRAQGEVSGMESVTLLQPNLPAHAHTVAGNLSVKCNPNGANADTPEGAYFGPSATQIYNDSAAGGFMAADAVSINAVTTVIGSNIPVGLMNPFIAMNYIICTQGIYPPRP